jgi:hypothetical protein
MNRFFTVSLFFVLLLTACSSNVTTVSPTNVPSGTGYPAMTGTQSADAYPGPNIAPNPTVDINKINPPKDAPQPENGKASISGILYSKTSFTALTNFLVYLTPAQGPDKNLVPPVLVGPLEDKGDVKAITDQTGKFEINNLAPGNYYFIVRNPTTYDVATVSMDTDTPRMITLSENQRLPLGIVIVP